MGLFKKKNIDYDELFTKLAAGNLSARELKNAEKALEELAESGDARGVIWRPLINIYKHEMKLAVSSFSFAERQYGICEEYVRVRSLPVVFGLFSFWYDKYHEPASAVFTARSYEYGWGTEADHARALEIIRDAAERIHEGAFVSYAPVIKKVYLEIMGEEIPEQKNPSATSGESAEKGSEMQSSCGSKSEAEAAPFSASCAENGVPEMSAAQAELKRLEIDHEDDSGCDEEPEESDTGDNVLLRYQNGDSYRGAAVGGVREGFGAYFFADGGFYRGCFHADNYEGYGMLDEGNGKVYKGLWKNDKRCGYGEQTYANGEVYRGWWKDNRFHGFGRYEFLNGAVDLGEFYNNLHEGIFLIRREGQWFGTLWRNDEIVPEPNGPEVIDIGSDSRYTGEIVRRRNGNMITRVKHGYGKYRFSHRNGADTVDGYIGEFENDAPCGSGMVIHTVGDFLAVLISSDFRGEAMPEGECRMISLTTQGTTQYAEYYIGGFHDSKCRGKGMLSLLGNKNVCDFNWYGGLYSGSIISCDSFNDFPTGDITVVDEYGRRTQMHLNG